jgi:hypothetical protein
LHGQRPRSAARAAPLRLAPAPPCCVQQIERSRCQPPAAAAEPRPSRAPVAQGWTNAYRRPTSQVIMPAQYLAHVDYVSSARRPASQNLRERRRQEAELRAGVRRRPQSARPERTPTPPATPPATPPSPPQLRVLAVETETTADALQVTFARRPGRAARASSARLRARQVEERAYQARRERLLRATQVGPGRIAISETDRDILPANLVSSGCVVAPRADATEPHRRRACRSSCPNRTAAGSCGPCRTRWGGRAATSTR